PLAPTIFSHRFSSVMDLSIVIPVRNEVDSVAPLAGEIDAVFANSPDAWECIWVDDGSDDGTLPALKLLHARNPAHQFVSLTRSSGQSAALSVGIENARGHIMSTLDGDLQNDPAELPRLLKML